MVCSSPLTDAENRATQLYRKGEILKARKQYLKAKEAYEAAARAAPSHEVTPTVTLIINVT